MDDKIPMNYKMLWTKKSYVQQNPMNNKILRTTKSYEPYNPMNNKIGAPLVLRLTAISNDIQYLPRKLYSADYFLPETARVIFQN